MRALGAAVSILGVVLLVQGWFVPAWSQGGLAGQAHWVVIGGGAALLVAGLGLLARQRWGGVLAISVAGLLALMTTLDDVSRAVDTLDGPPPALGALPVWSPPPIAAAPTREWATSRGSDPQWRAALAGFEQQVAAELGERWWAVPVTELHRLRRGAEAQAHDWEIQGDARIRLIVLTDPYLEISDDIPLNIFLLVRGEHGRVARAVIDGFYVIDREAPVELRLADGTATVIARGDRACLSRRFTVDVAAGTIAPAGEDGGC